jgi:hypothetical protein
MRTWKPRRAALTAALAALFLSQGLLWAAQPELWASAAIEGSYSFGSLASVSPASLGGETGIETEDFLLAGLHLGLAVDYAFCFPALSKLTSLQEAFLLVTGGYRFDLGPSLSLTPIVGCGYGGDMASYDGSTLLGGQLVAIGGGKLSYRLNEAWKLAATLEYRGRAESSTFYSEACLGIGAAYRLPVAKGGVDDGTK